MIISLALIKKKQKNAEIGTAQTAISLASLNARPSININKIKPDSFPIDPETSTRLTKQARRHN